MLVIINDILDFSKIEAGKLKIEPINFNLSELIKNLYNRMLVRANEKKLNLNYLIKSQQIVKIA